VRVVGRSDAGLLRRETDHSHAYATGVCIARTAGLATRQASRVPRLRANVRRHTD
jgi:hypothetical protein